MIIVMAKATIAEVNMAAYLEDVRESGVVAAVREERGCVSYDVSVSGTEEGVLYINERWEDFSAMQGHLKGKNMRTLAKINGKFRVQYEANVYSATTPL